MKKTISFIAVIIMLVMSGTLLANAFISYFIARSEGENVILEWKVDQENNISKYLIERKSGNSDYSLIASVPAEAKTIYTWEDKNLYKTSDNFYKYKIYIINKQGDHDGEIETSISVSLSSVKRTWGSIKAMFR